MIANVSSTYRIQFNKDFTLSHLKKIIPYLHHLGIKTIYASPIFEATPGSTHGYDGTNPNNINPEIGNEQELREISTDLKQRKMMWLQDIVPNHLAFHENNKWLMDVLEKGQASEYAPYFDIIWNHPEFGDKLMVPFPGSELENLLMQKYPEGEHYAFVPWQDTDNKINYRRFFLVNSLICTNIHDKNVFDHYHELIKKLSDEKLFDGLRVDHVDGLYDPVKYLHDLRKLAGENAYIIVEKILEPGENMPSDWPVQGTSGYDFLGMVNNLFTNRNAEFEFAALYYDTTGDQKTVEQQVHDKKAAILFNHMRGELDNLVRLYRECGLADNSNITDDELKDNIANYLIMCPVYRYYGKDIPKMKRDEHKSGEQVNRFYYRCMQFTGPLMAKGVEDTLMYTYNRFIGHNEVGDSPELFGYTVEQFHELMKYRHEHWPLSMNGSSTHDTKRGEDVRARLNALTCFPDEWSSMVKLWTEENKSLKRNGYPDSNDEYFIYQTLIGSYPAGNEKELQKYPERMTEYLRKSLREGKVNSNWAEPNEQYEEACISFAHRLIDHKATFHRSFDPFVEKIIYYGSINSFAQLVLKFTCPGIPDVYQGTELWDLSLVDPDNRRPVNFELRQQLLESENSFKAGDVSEPNKLYLLRELLKIRNDQEELFTRGTYEPIVVPGKLSGHVLAFIRKHGRSAILVIVPTTFALVDGEVGDTGNLINELIPENFVKRQLLYFSDLLQIVHLDFIA